MEDEQNNKLIDNTAGTSDASWLIKDKANSNIGERCITPELRPQRCLESNLIKVLCHEETQVRS